MVAAGAAAAAPSPDHERQLPIGTARAAAGGDATLVAARRLGHDPCTMCGRFTLTKPRSLLAAEAFAELLASPEAAALLQQLAPRFNVAPSQDVLVLPNTDDGKPELQRWGLIPPWAKDDKIGYRTINARAETVASKPAFRRALVKRRCLIPADGFYEWQAVPGDKRKRPHYIRRRDGQPFAFAGLWEVWRPRDARSDDMRSGGGDPVRSCTIITTQPNALVAPIHERMPVILPAERFAQWLDPEPEPEAAARLGPLLVSCPAEELEAYAVGRLVNAAGEDRPECILPAAEREPDEAPRRQPARQTKLFD